MDQNTRKEVDLTIGSRDALTEILRQGARKMLQEAIEAEVSDYVARHAQAVDDQGHRRVVRNGVRKGRTVQIGIGQIEIDLPRIDDRRLDANGERCRFTRSILPPYLRKTKTLEAFIPWLYLEGDQHGRHE